MRKVDSILFSGTGTLPQVQVQGEGHAKIPGNEAGDQSSHQRSQSHVAAQGRIARSKRGHDDDLISEQKCGPYMEEEQGAKHCHWGEREVTYD